MQNDGRDYNKGIDTYILFDIIGNITTVRR